VERHEVTSSEAAPMLQNMDLDLDINQRRLYKELIRFLIARYKVFYRTISQVQSRYASSDEHVLDPNPTHPRPKVKLPLSTLRNAMLAFVAGSKALNRVSALVCFIA